MDGEEFKSTFFDVGDHLDSNLKNLVFSTCDQFSDVTSQFQRKAKATILSQSINNLGENLIDTILSLQEVCSSLFNIVLTLILLHY